MPRSLDGLFLVAHVSLSNVVQVHSVIMFRVADVFTALEAAGDFHATACAKPP